MGEKPQEQTAPSETAQAEGDGFALPPEPAVSPIDIPNSCPSGVNGITLVFEDAHTDATRATIKAWDEATRDPKFIEPDKERAIQFVDLDNDGDEDFLALYSGINWCGSAGCLVEVFVNDGKEGYEGSQAFYTGKGDAVVLESVLNGFRQVITPMGENGLPSERYLWRWNGKEYVSDVRCLALAD